MPTLADRAATDRRAADKSITRSAKLGSAPRRVWAASWPLCDRRE